ncbi:MAG TPA: DUF6491 family protein [Steroidobacteraceae bacterium]|nr:DUF6491 family protein [Steroidobacteraceae bacterium]
MNIIRACSAAVLAGLCAAAAVAAPSAGRKSAPAAAAPEAQIPFANHHGIYDWDVINDRTLLIQSEGGTWYKATLMSPCFDLPFAERLGFKTNPDGSFDRFSAILVRHQRCPLTSLVVTTAPRGKSPHHEVPVKPARAKKP